MSPLSLILAMALSASPTLSVDVYVPLCDSALIACGRGAAGDPTSLEGNLYWGARYGAERYLSKAPGFKIESRVDAPDPRRPHLLREVTLVRRAAKNEHEVRIRLLAYQGAAIDRALEDFLAAAAGATDAHLVVWAGHDRLMDVPPPRVARTRAGQPVVVLACSSERFFGPTLAAIGAKPLALTRTFMAPEAYLLEALVGRVAKDGLSARPIRQALIAAYAQYQKLGVRSAASVFSPLD